MAQLNLNLTPRFESALKKLMRVRHFRTKSEAIRAAVQESLERASAKAEETDFKGWVGLGRKWAENPAPRFTSDERLWERG